MADTPNLRFIQLACAQIRVAQYRFVETGRDLGSSIVGELVRFFEERKDSYLKCDIRALIRPIDGRDNGVRKLEVYEISKDKLYFVSNRYGHDPFGGFCYIPESQDDKTFCRYVASTNHVEPLCTQEILNLVFEIYFPNERVPFINYLTGYSRDPAPR